MKPSKSEIPFPLCLGFVALQTVVLCLGAIYFFGGSHRVAAIFGDTLIVVQLSLLGVLLLTSIGLLFFDRRLALTGFIAFILGALAGVELPRHSSTAASRPHVSNVAQLIPGAPAHAPTTCAPAPFLHALRRPSAVAEF